MQIEAASPRKNGMRLRGASLMQKWKRTAIFTLRFKMLTGRTPELSAPKFLLAQNGVRFDKWCSAGERAHGRSGVTPAIFAMTVTHLQRFAAQLDLNRSAVTSARMCVRNG